MNARVPITLTLLAMSGSLVAQVVGSSSAVTSPLSSSGYNCWTQTGWNQAVPVGTLSAGATSMPGVTWNLAASSLSGSAAGSGGLCSFWTPPSYFSASGAVEVTLASPFDTAVLVSVAGSVSGPSTGGGPLPVGGASSFSAKVDGVTLASIVSGGSGPSSANQSTLVTVGPAGVVLSLQVNSSISGSFGSSGSTSTNVTLSWSQFDAAAVTSVPGGCAAPTPTPTFVAAGLPIIGATIEADILQAQGPSPLGFVMFGLQQAMIPLDSIGMPGCFASQPMFLAFVAQPTGPSALHVSVALPNQPWLVGVMLYSQAFTQALGVNANDLVAGNSLHWRLGT
ncbi:MAG: hypothetical protein VX044_09810 [Planctomycetota bacterium]|nr:hypothetical protein [Planctomycetota bacterium]